MSADQNDRTSTAKQATYENEWMFRQDEDAWDDYQAYLTEHDAYRLRGGILYADDFVGWLNDDPRGQVHRDRVLDGSQR